MKNKRMLKVFLILLLILTVFGFFIGMQKKKLNSQNIDEIKGESIDNFTIQSKEQDNILITVERLVGIQKIEMPNGEEIYCNNNTKVAFDYQVEKDKNYTFKITDSEDNLAEETVYAPNLHLELTKNKLQIDFNALRDNLRSKLWSDKIATNYVTIGIGVESYVDTQSTDMVTVFNNWSSFGDGDWKYDSTNKYVYNTKNTNYFTGYYAPNGNYTDIELQFEARTTDGDDDMIGAMIRFNRSGNNYNSYLFLLDRHDNGGGISNGAYNGLNKVINNNLGASGTGVITKLSVNSSLRWTRNTWQKYKLIAKGNTLQAYLDNKLVASATDTSISSGSYGFLCLSQAKTYFRNISIATTKENTFEDIVNSVIWDVSENNIVIKFNNEAETTLNSENNINKFNDENIHYIGVGSENNKTDIETFIQNIDNKGIYIDGTLEIDSVLSNVVMYIDGLIK